MQIQVIGFEDIVKNLKVSQTKAIEQLKVAVGVGCEKIKQETVNKISTVGEPDGVPRRRTGNLMASIRVGKQVTTLTSVSQTVGANPDTDGVGYAMWLEFGTSKMKPRPYLSVVANEQKENILKQMAKAVNKVF
jgi:HK97 gp10 family phage protein